MAPTALAECASALGTLPRDAKRIVVSGPPCQGFSVAGPRETKDPRNRILSGVARAIVHLAPDAALIENVAALSAARHNRHLSRLTTTLKSGGYHCIILVLNAVDFGVPQHRQRMMCFATRKKLSEASLVDSLTRLQRDPMTVREAFRGLRAPPIYRGPADAGSSLVANHVAMRHSQRVRTKIANIAPGTGPMSYRKLHPERPARTLISGNRAPPAHPTQNRSITTREAARLQGFPDSFHIMGTFSNQMLHVTNAVPPPLARAALTALFCSLE